MKAKGKLGCACKLQKEPGMGAGKHRELSSQSEFVIPEIAVNGVIMATGLVVGALGWNNQDTPLGRLLLGAGGGLTALGIAFLIREAFVKREAA
jgi:hypothetical protein